MLTKLRTQTRWQKKTDIFLNGSLNCKSKLKIIIEEKVFMLIYLLKNIQNKFIFKYKLA